VSCLCEDLVVGLLALMLESVERHVVVVLALPAALVRIVPVVVAAHGVLVSLQ
jgi:hypothetical protein